MTGILNVIKPEGITSFRLVSIARGITGEKKIGHTGTLDPMASGVMTLLLGGATRFCSLLPDHDKAYKASILLGVSTDTLDITGTVTGESAVSVTERDFVDILPSFTGLIRQRPPMYSAVSVDGKRLYQLARQGIEVETPEREVNIFSIGYLGKGSRENEYIISVSCSRGTYIRSLARDIGEALGCPAVLTHLERTKANSFTTDECFTLEELQKAKDSGCIASCLRPLDSCLAPYPAVNVTPAQAVRFRNGGELAAGRFSRPADYTGYVRVYSESEFLGLGEIREEDLEVARVFMNH